MRILLVVAVTALLPLIASAQNKFGREFVVGMSNDTIYGQVSVSSANRRISSVEFVREGAAFTEELDVKQIAGFYDEVWGFYITGDIVEKSDYFEPVKKRVLFEVIVLGKLDLLTYYNSGQTRFYLREEGGKLEELILLSYVKEIEGRQLRMKDERYKRLLNLHMADCSTTNVEKVKFDEKSLKKAFIDYHACIGSVPELFEVKAKGKWEFGAIAGIGYSLIDLGNDHTDTYTGPQLGLYTEYFVFKKHPRLSLIAELNWKKLEASTQYDFFYQNAMSERFMDVDLTYLRLNTFLNYKITKGLTVLGGVSNSFVISSNVNSYIQSPVFGKVETSGDIKKYEQGVVLGIGYRVGRLSIQSRYEFSSGFGQINYYTPGSSVATKVGVKINTYYLLAAYKF